MGRSIMLHFLFVFAFLGVLALLALLQHFYGHDFRHHDAPRVTVAVTLPALSPGSAPDEVDRVILRKLERGDLSCVNGYVSVLRMESGTARAYVIRTSKGPARCRTVNARGVQTSL